MVKLIANYLPQFHITPENNMWWGEGYTDWVATRNSKPQFDNHDQPRIPLDSNYYDLSKVEAVRNQAVLAREYGIYGFGIYHYWFSKEQHYLEKPARIILDNKDIDIHYMFIWDNVSWKRTWSNIPGTTWVTNEEEKNGADKRVGNGILAELKYGKEEDWEYHFTHLLDFFKDDRYIKIDNKPVFVFFNEYNDYQCINKMIAYWDALAKKYGFSGIYTIGRYDKIAGKVKKSVVDYYYEYEPFSHVFGVSSIWQRLKNKILGETRPKQEGLSFFDFDEVWQRILDDAQKNANQKIFYGAIGDYDDSPRRGANGKIVKGATPEKLRRYLSKLLSLSKKHNKEYVFYTAWNEWGEGAYLEPDEKNRYAYLEAVKASLQETDLIRE